MAEIVQLTETAEVLSHPARDAENHVAIFDFGLNGCVVIRSTPGEVLSKAEAISLLERAKYRLLQSMGD